MIDQLSTDLILIRTRQVDAHNLRFADELRGASGSDVMLVVDEMDGRSPSDSPNILSLNGERLKELELFAPHDTAWRCGDYGLYLAKSAFPSYAFYWVFDDDLRVAGDARRFFEACRERSDIDLFGIFLKDAVRGHYWWPHLANRNGQAGLCNFGVLRVSARAVDASLETRRRQSRQWSRRALWPNDEGMVATTVKLAGLLAADFELLDPELYSAASLSVTNAASDTFARSGPPRLIHPVRFQDRPNNPRRAKTRDDADSLAFRIRAAALRRLNAKRTW